MNDVYLALGSNLNHPLLHIHTAIADIHQHPSIHVRGCSNLYDNPALDLNQPRFINAVIHVNTSLSPFDLLDVVQAIEQQHGRSRATGFKGPRALDIDIVYANFKVDAPRLTVPHPALWQRDFVWVPLLELLPDLPQPPELEVGMDMRKIPSGLAERYAYQTSIPMP